MAKALEKNKRCRLKVASSIILPVVTVGQTWLPYLVAVLREQTGSYALPLAVAIAIAVVGWVLLVSLPEAKKVHG